MTPIRKGSNPVKIPFAIKSNDQTFAAWANEVVTAIRQLEARVPTANIGRGSAATSSQFKVSIRLDGATYKVKVRPGYVRTINPDSAATEPVKDWMLPRRGQGGRRSYQGPGRVQTLQLLAQKL